MHGAHSHELATALKEAVIAYDSVDKWAKEEKAPFRLDTFLLSPRIRKEPKGVVLIIGYATKRHLNGCVCVC